MVIEGKLAKFKTCKTVSLLGSCMFYNIYAFLKKIIYGGKTLSMQVEQDDIIRSCGFNGRCFS